MSTEPIIPPSDPTVEPSTEPVTVPPAPEAEPTPVPPPPIELTDRTQVNRFREAGPEAAARLNADFSLHMNETRFARLQHYFTHIARRDPTVGELRFLDAQERTAHARETLRLPSVGEFATDSRVLAETWADMQQKHVALHRELGTRQDAAANTLPPLSCEAGLLLLSRYLRRTGALDADAHDAVAVISTPRQELEALTLGYSPVARAYAEDGRTLTVVKRATRHGTAPRETAARAGDLILYCASPSLSSLAAVLTEEWRKSTPDIHAMRAVTDRSLTATLCELAPAFELYADRLIEDPASRTKGFLPIRTLCDTPPAGGAGVLLRVPVSRAYTLMETWRRAGLHTNAIAKVLTGDCGVLCLRNAEDTRDEPVVRFPTAQFAKPDAQLLGRYRPAVMEASTPELHTSALSRLPSCLPEENGLTPTGGETVALTAAPGNVLHLPEENLYMATLSTRITQTGTGYSAAMEAIRTTVECLCADGTVTPQRGTPRLSVTLTVSRSAASDDEAPAVICGLYRAAAERGLPIEESLITAGPTSDEAPSIGLDIVAWAIKTPEPVAKKRRRKADTAPLVSAPSPVGDKQWTAGHALVHKESPRFLFPVTRRSSEGGLRAVFAALNRRAGAVCHLQPLILEQAVVASSDPDASATPETHMVLHSTSIEALTTHIAQWNTPVFAMSDSDTRLLLKTPAIRETIDRLLEMGYPVIVLGEACRTFAELGYLPDALRTLTLHPMADQRTATVSYRFTSAPDASVTRILRRALLAPAEVVPSLLTLDVGGLSLPDGFVGREGLVLGVLNGLDSVLADTLVRYPYQRFPCDM